MSQRYDVLVFDWDGTLMDSTAHIVAAIQQAFRLLALPEPSREAASHVIGLGLREAMEYLCPSLQPADYQQLTGAYRQYYLGQPQATVLFDGVAAALQRYKEQDFLLAVATGKSRIGLDRVLAETGLTGLFDITRCADETFSKPHPAMLQEITDYLGLDVRRAVMVGDTTHDLLMAVNAGCDGVGVSYGAHPKAELLALAPVACCDSFAELDLWLTDNA